MTHNMGWRSALVFIGLFTFSVALLMFPSYQLLVKPRGQSFDLYSTWVGGRAVLSGQNPYGPEPTRLIQLGIYKKLIPPPEYQHGFSLPAYITFVLLPFILLPFPCSVLLWISLQIPLFMLTLMIGLDVLDWSVGPFSLFLLAILTILGFRYPVIAYTVGQLTIFVLFCIVLSAWLYRHNHPRWAAVALAWATIRPDLSLAAILSALVLVKDSPRRNEFIATLLGTGVILVMLPTILVGFWPLTWLKTIRAYGHGNPFVTWPPGLLPSPWLIGVLVIGVTVWTAYYLLFTWQKPTPFSQGLLVSAVVLWGLIILPQTGSYTLTIALIPALILLRHARPRWLRVMIAGSLLTPWLYFLLDQHLGGLIFLLIPLQFILLQESVRHFGYSA